MILLLGIADDPPLVATARSASGQGVPWTMFDQRRWSDHVVDLRMDGAGAVEGVLTVAGRRIDVGEISGALVRLADPSELISASSSGAERCRRLHEDLCAWLEVTACRVCNRAGASATNLSKPFQQQLIAEAGLLTPETLVTNDPDEVRWFAAIHERVIYKSTSAIRSIVQELTPDRLAEIGGVRALPTQFQRLLEGTDVRVHVVGQEVFATEIVSTTIDYRYARPEAPSRMHPCDLPEDLTKKCLTLSEALGLPLCGIDFKRTEAGEYYCFEVNPAPAFTCFEERTRQPIAAAVSRYLAGGGQ